MDQPESEGVRLLSFDGSDIRAISQLLILDEFMRRVEWDRKSDTRILPCDYFHMMAGAGTGGIIVMLLVVLRMGIEETIEEFINIWNVVFVDRTLTPAARSAKLEVAIKDLLKRRGVPENQKLYSGKEEDSSCKAFICAVPESNLGMCEKFRSYNSRETSTNPTIVEAIRATCAIPTLFTPVSIESVGCQISYVTGTYNFNNPAWETIKEACQTFGQRRLVACMLSLGCGQRPIVRLSQKNEATVMGLVNDIASDTELVDRDLAWRIGKSNVYYRLSVDRNLEFGDDSALGLTGDITSCTKGFLEHASMVDKVNQCMKASECLGRITLTDIAGLSEPRPATTYGLPSLSAFFVERLGLIKEMADCLFRVGPPVQRRIVISGMGGIGKTQITISFLHQFLSRFRHVLFIDGSSVQSLESGVVAKVKSLGITYTRASVSEALEVLANPDHEITRDWAIIYDNVDDPNVNIADYFPPCSFGTIIITTRNPNLGNLALQSHLMLDVMSKEEAVEVLLRSAFGPSHSITNTDQQHACEIAEELGYLPVALIQAGYFIKIHGCIHDYRQRLSEQRPDILGRPARDQLDKHYHGIYAALNVTWPHLSTRSQDFMSILGFVNYTGFPIILLYRAADGGFFFEPFNLMDRPALFQQTIQFLRTVFRPHKNFIKQDVDDLVAELKQYSLVTTTTTFNVEELRLHPLIHSWAHDRLSQQEKLKYREAAIRLLVCGTGIDDQDLYEFLYPHVTLLSDQLNKMHANDQAGLAEILAHQGDLATAIELYEGIQKSLGDNRGIWSLLGFYGQQSLRSSEADLQLARLYLRSGNWEKRKVATVLRKGVVDIRKQTLGSEHPRTMEAIVQVARSMPENYYDPEAVSILRGALRFWERQPGDHWETILQVKEELASCSDKEERPSLYTEVLQARMERSGPDHHSTLRAMENLARAYSSRWRGGDETMGGSATDTWISVVAARTNKRGIEHPDTLNAMENLALSYGRSRADGKRVAQWEKVVELRKAVQGPCHPWTLRAMRSLANCYDSESYAASVRQWKEVLHFTREAKGPSHEDTFSARKSLARVYEASNQCTKSPELWKEIPHFAHEGKGRSHEDTLSTMKSPVRASEQSDQYTDSIELWNEMLHFTRRVKGPSHEDTLSAMKSLARAYEESRQYTESAKLWKEILHFTQEVKDPSHGDTISAMKSLARMYYKSKQYTEWELQWKEIQKFTREVKGSCCPSYEDTIYAVKFLVRVYEQSKQYTKLALQLKEILRFARQEKVHEDALCAMKSLARTYTQSEQFANSAELWKEILHFTRELHGPGHEDTLWAMTVLARMYDKSEQYAESAEQWKEVVRLRKDSNGPVAGATLDCMRCLAEVSMKCGSNAEPEALLRDAARAVEQAPSVDGSRVASLKES